MLQSNPGASSSSLLFYALPHHPSLSKSCWPLLPNCVLNPVLSRGPHLLHLFWLRGPHLVPNCPLALQELLLENAKPLPGPSSDFSAPVTRIKTHPYSVLHPYASNPQLTVKPVPSTKRSGRMTACGAYQHIKAHGGLWTPSESQVPVTHFRVCAGMLLLFLTPTACSIKVRTRSWLRSRI